MELVKTGIAGFDAATGGGIPTGTRTLLYGPPGTGKTVFALHFLWTGLQAGEAVACNASDRPFAHLRRYFRSFGWETDAFEADGHLLPLQSFPHPESRPRDERIRYWSGGPLENWQSVCSTLEERQVTRFIGGEQSQAAFAVTSAEALLATDQWLVDWVLHSNVTMLEIVTATQMDVEGHRGWALSLKSLHNVIQFRIEGVRREVRILKMEGAQHPLEWVPIEIGPHGIEMGVV